MCADSEVASVTGKVLALSKLVVEDSEAASVTGKGLALSRLVVGDLFKASCCVSNLTDTFSGLGSSSCSCRDSRKREAVAAMPIAWITQSRERVESVAEVCRDMSRQLRKGRRDMA